LRRSAWFWGAWAAAMLMAAAVSFSLLRIPIQVPDSLLVMLDARAAPSAALSNFMGERGFLRPVYISQTRLLLDAAGGEHYFLVFRGFHAALVAVLFVLFVMAARVRTRTDFAAFTLGLLVLTGIHTFRGNVWEAYPVNHYLEIAVCSLAAFVLCQSRGGWWADLLALVLFIAASLTIESGLIVVVVILTARFVGLRGVSWTGTAFVMAALAGYFYLRFVYLGTGAPSLDERATGFGFGTLERGDIIPRFGDAPYMLYSYNLVSSVLSVLLSEPRSGTWEMTRRWMVGDVAPSVIVSWVSALTATGLLVWFAGVRFRVWLARRCEHADQLVLVCLAVTAANAVFCYTYTKDEIMSTAGVFYALAVFAASRTAITRFARVSRGTLRSAALTLLLLVCSASWAIRATGLHYHMYYAGYNSRNEWVAVEVWLREQRVEPTEEGTRLIEELRSAAIEMPGLNPYFLPRWSERWFD
jgi:hypothetical protein